MPGIIATYIWLVDIDSPRDPFQEHIYCPPFWEMDNLWNLVEAMSDFHG